MFKTILEDQVKLHLSSTIPMWLKRVRPDILAWVLDETSQIPVKNTMERVFIIINGEPPRCSDGNYRKFNTYETGYRICCNLGHKCKDVALNRVINQRNNLLEKYGVTNAAQLDSVKQKTRETNLRKYGTEHHSQNDEIKKKTLNSYNMRTDQQRDDTQQKRKQTSLEKYGVEHHMKSSSQQAKVKTTNIDRYGVPFPLQNTESLLKMKTAWKAIATEASERQQLTCETRYGVSWPGRIGMSSEVLEILDNEELFKSYVTGKERRDVTEELGIHPHTLYLYSKKYNASSLFYRPVTSQLEMEIASWLDSAGIVYEQSNRTIIGPQELDFYLPLHNLAIECGGLYWHSELSAGRKKTYHIEKHRKCLDKNIQLITLFQDEWNEKQELIKQLIMNKCLKQVPLFARKCEVKEISVAEAKQFIMSNHLQGYTGSSIRVGLFHDDVLISVMTFGKPRYNSNNEWELIRYCSIAQVTGGASRLFSYFNATYSPKSIVSYSDNRWFTGRLYEQLGFTKEKTTIGYTYTDYKKRYDRTQFQKHKLVNEGYDPALSEWHIMQSRGFDRIWDCGQTMWEYHRNKDKYQHEL